MKAALCTRFEGEDNLSITDVPTPEAGPGEVLIRVRAAALNFFDTLIIRNRYQYKPQLPFSPAAEIAGEIVALGPGVAGFEPGQRVLAYMGWGGAREMAVVKAEACVPVPDAVSDVTAAGLSVTYGTARHGLKDRAGLKSGESLAVLGAAGGAGLAAVEIGARMGARVIAVASSADKLALCRAHGAAEAINYAETDLKEALKEVTAGKGVDVVYDCVGSEHTEAAVRALAWGGRHLVVGFAAGTIPRIPINLLLLKGSAMLGVFWGEFVRRNPRAQRDNIAEVLSWIESGVLTPHVHATYPLDKIGEALAAIANRQVQGKAVLIP
jgi:NADPH2:quinone reductase